MPRPTFEQGSALVLGDIPGSRAQFEAALALVVSTGDAIGVVLSRTELGWLLVDRVDLDEAESAATAALEEARVLADPTTHARSYP